MEPSGESRADAKLSQLERSSLGKAPLAQITTWNLHILNIFTQKSLFWTKILAPNIRIRVCDKCAFFCIFRYLLKI